MAGADRCPHCGALLALVGRSHLCRSRDHRVVPLLSQDTGAYHAMSKIKHLAEISLTVGPGYQPVLASKPKLTAAR